MKDYLIIDSSENFASKLHKSLGGPGNTILNSAIFPSVSAIANEINNRVKEDLRTAILINAETEVNDQYLQHQPILELILWLRCKYGLRNPVVFYSCYTVIDTLQRQPGSYALLSPGSYYIKLPFTYREIEKIRRIKPIGNINEIRPFLKPAISFENVRHRYANYTGIAMMLDVAKSNNKRLNDTDILGSDILSHSVLSEFKSSLDYNLLKTYYDYQSLDSAVRGVVGRLDRTKRILLIDDMALEGWQHVLGYMLYGDSQTNSLRSLPIKSDAKGKFDETQNIKELHKQLLYHKPHLILLDLRLNNEEGKVSLNQLGGYKILKHIRTNPDFKGVHVIMFLASVNAHTIKELLKVGATGIWTKPGIDEVLDKTAIVRRYEELFKLVNNVLEPDHKIIDDLNDDDHGKLFVDFDYIRREFFQRFDFLKYSLKLHKRESAKLVPDEYKQVDVIYLDSNIFLSGSSKHSYWSIISATLKLAKLLPKSDHGFITKCDIRNIDSVIPKVVILNSVYDEIIQIAKKDPFVENSKSNKRCMRALISQMVIKELFSTKCVRTEFIVHNREDNVSGKIETIVTLQLMSSRQDAYADPVILDDVATLILTRKAKGVEFDKNTRVMVISGDGPLTEKLVRLDYEEVNGSMIKSNRLIIKDRNQFISDMSKIIV